MRERNAWGRAVALVVVLGTSVLAGACASAEESTGSRPSGSSGSSGGGDSCTSSNCDGCCSGSTCIPFSAQNRLSCGRYGSKCSSCEEGEECSSYGSCDTDYKTCSALTCATGCCDDNGECQFYTDSEQCGFGGEACKPCETMALCTSTGKCANNQWADNAKMDLYIDQVTASSCTDVGSPPDLVFTINDGTQNYGKSCEDQNPCVFATPLKIPSLDRFDFTLERLKFAVGDTDVASDDGCFSGTLPLVDRDLKPHTLKFAGGTVTVRLLPAGK